ncbi:MAG: CNNM domain-containing protein [Planctomycetota bacterium]
MIFFVLFLFLLGVFLSGFFSGSETGFYRASRVRFVMDGIDGDSISKRMVWLFNNPTLFVATTLVGNNVANYMVSLAVVLAARIAFPNNINTAELLAPIALSPALFVYGELFPKSVFFIAPNRMLRLASPFFLFFTGLFAPIAAILWSLGRLLEKMLGQSPETVRLHLARRELQDVLQEGQEAGLLNASQRLLGQNFFLVASTPVIESCTPIRNVQSFQHSANSSNLLKFAQRKKLAEIVIYDHDRNDPIGYVRTVDLLVERGELTDGLPTRPFIQIRANELFGEALLQLQAKKETVGLVISEVGKPVGIISMNQLTDPLLKGPLGSLRR